MRERIKMWIVSIKLLCLFNIYLCQNDVRKLHLYYIFIYIYPVRGCMLLWINVHTAKRSANPQKRPYQKRRRRGRIQSAVCNSSSSNRNPNSSLVFRLLERDELINQYHFTILHVNIDLSKHFMFNDVFQHVTHEQSLYTRLFVCM